MSLLDNLKKYLYGMNNRSNITSETAQKKG